MGEDKPLKSGNSIRPPHGLEKPEKKDKADRLREPDDYEAQRRQEQHYGPEADKKAMGNEHQWRGSRGSQSDEDADRGQYSSRRTTP